MNVFGERQDPEKFLALCIRKINNGDQLTIHGSEGNIGSRYYIHARNVADALLHILTKTKPDIYSDKGGVDRPSRYNIVGEQELNNLEMAQLIAKIMGKQLNYVLDDVHAQRPGHDRRYALSGEKLKKLGWIPVKNLENSLRKYINWTLENKQWL